MRISVVDENGNTTEMARTARPLYAIADEIRKHWPRPYFGAVPYIKAMACLGSIKDDYGHDSAKSIVLYFLSNASSWRGPQAKAIKAELKALAKVKD